MSELNKLPKDEDITSGFVKRYGLKTDVLTFINGEVNILEKEGSQLYPRKRTENVDKISLYATTNSGSDHVLDISEGNLVIANVTFHIIEPTDGEEIFKLFVPIV